MKSSWNVISRMFEMNRTSVSTAGLALSAVFAAWVLLAPAAQAAEPQSADVGASSSSRTTKSGSGQIKVPATNASVSETATTTTAIRGKAGTGAVVGQARATTAQRDAEFKAILHRADSIGAKLKSSKGEPFQQAKKDWVQLKSDLAAWAKKYNVRLIKKQLTLPLPKGMEVSGSGAAKQRPNPKESKTVGWDMTEEGEIYHCDHTMIIEGLECVLYRSYVVSGRLVCEYVCRDPSRK